MILKCYIQAGSGEGWHIDKLVNIQQHCLSPSVLVMLNNALANVRRPRCWDFCAF